MSHPHQNAADPWPQGPTAGGNAHIGQMSSVHNGDTAIHYGDATYNINQDDPPEVKEQIALNQLRGGMPRPAEETLRPLLTTGHATTRRCFYYALAVFSDRSLPEIDRAVIDEFILARRSAEGFHRDTWRDGLDVILELVRRAWKYNFDAPDDESDKPGWRARFEALPPAQRTEITRHLELILDGFTQERLEESENAQVVDERLADRRTERAWKFFEPDPVQPVPFRPEITDIPTAVWARAVGGGTACLVGVVGLLSSLWQPAALLAAALLGVGGYLLVVGGAARAETVIRHSRKEAELDNRVPDGPPPSPGHWVRTGFVAQVHQRVDKIFSLERRHIAGDWSAQLRGVRYRLTARLAELYGNSRIDAEQLDWLIRFHARRCATQWAEGTLFGHRAELAESPRSLLLRRCGIGAFAAGVVLLAGHGSPISALLLGAGGYFANSSTHIVGARRADIARAAEVSELHEAEKREYERWCRVLADRPTDPEMGKWLDLDKAYLKTAAMGCYSLTARDLVAHAITLEKTPRAAQAAVPGGPPRYTHYLVKIFLLSLQGVRFVEFEFDFCKGVSRDQNRNAFHYGALTSAGVSEVGIRAADPNRYSVQRQEDGGGMETARLRSRALRLTLNSGEQYNVIVNKFNRNRDIGAVEESDLRARELNSSGVSTTVRILELVASEGREWVQREQDRRARLQRLWQEREQ